MENKETTLRRKLMPSGATRKGMNLTSSALKTILSPARSSRQESFEEATERLNWTEADIQKFAHFRKTELKIFWALFAVAFFFACFFPYSAHPISHLLASLAVMIMMGSKILVTHFRLTQIRDRSMYSFGEYLSLVFPFFSSTFNDVKKEMAAAPDMTAPSKVQRIDRHIKSKSRLNKERQ